jgi:hypothetical protein
LVLETADNLVSLAGVFRVLNETTEIDRNALDELLIRYGSERLSTCPSPGRGLMPVRNHPYRSAGTVPLDSTGRR